MRYSFSVSLRFDESSQSQDARECARSEAIGEGIYGAVHRADAFTADRFASVW
jgi:hypothetical protein